MKPLLIGYSKCSTCKKACEYLSNNNIAYDFRDIKEEKLTSEEIPKLIEQYNIEIDRLFNTSGLLYRSLNLKEKRPTMNKNEKIAILASNGMLVKRPLLITKNKMFIGFNEKEWGEYAKTNQ